MSQDVVHTVESVRQADRLYHDLLTSDETQRVRAEARAVARQAVRPAAHAIAQADEAVATFPRQVFDDLARAGLFRVPFPAAIEGRGLAEPATATAVTIEELAYYSNSVAAVYDVHCILAGHALAAGSADLHHRYLAPLLAGDVVGSFATTEPDASSDLSPDAITTVATPTAGGWSVSGRKRWISNSPVAGFVVTLCRTGQDLSLLVVDTDAPGVRVGPPDRKLGNRGQLTADVWFDDVPVPRHNLVGEPGGGLGIALATLTYGRIGIAAAGVGMAQAAFDLAADHLLRRRAFGRPLAAFQHWQFRMAERATEIENARNLYLKAARRRDAGVRFPEPEAAMAKSYATTLAVDMARDAVQVFGGYGFMRELAAEGATFGLEALYRDSKIGEIYEGTNEIQKWIIARQLFGRDVTG